MTFVCLQGVEQERNNAIQRLKGSQYTGVDTLGKELFLYFGPNALRWEVAECLSRLQIIHVSFICHCVPEVSSTSLPYWSWNLGLSSYFWASIVPWLLIFLRNYLFFPLLSRTKCLLLFHFWLFSFDIIVQNTNSDTLLENRLSDFDCGSMRKIVVCHLSEPLTYRIIRKVYLLPAFTAGYGNFLKPVLRKTRLNADYLNFKESVLLLSPFVCLDWVS